MKNTKNKNNKVKYYLNSHNEFVIENYNHSKPLANFFPGIAGKYGIPMWAFYVNRAQGMISFGTKDKDHAILEFFPANKAWQLVSSYGFRTFIKDLTKDNASFYEPFHNGFTNLKFSLTNRMLITSYDLKLEEENLSLGLNTKVEYFTIPNDSYAALVRIVSISNTTKKTKRLQLLDGLPQIVPYGTSNLFLKKLGRTIEAWMNVENLENKVPFYKLDVDPVDRPEVIHIKEGNFYLGFHYIKNRPQIIRPIVDPECIFAEVTDFSCPKKFINTKNFLPPRHEIIKSRTPCGFLPINLELNPQEEKIFYSLAGYMRNKETLNSSINKIVSLEYIRQKKEENKKLIETLQLDMDTKSSSKEFNLYAKQTYLDNIMRGGYPVSLRSDNTESIFYLYSRKHGDLERDYNKFQIQPTYFSQGNGNYRDANQNRRCDIWFHPQLKDENLIYFLNLIQTDGFNPLVVKGISFTLKETGPFKESLKGSVEEKNIEKIISFLDKPFTPGDVILFLEDNKIKLKISYDEFLALLVSCSIKNQEAEHGEGFWTDHWTYNLDLLESYLRVYPEKLKEIIFNKRVFTFYDNTEVVKPRNEKYILKDVSIKQLHSIAPCNAKREMIKKRDSFAHVVRTDFGLGQTYQTTLLNKLLCLLANKLASLDPFGCGIEMEADKPNWFDALNGLPALFGSSLCETFELKRLVIFIKNSLDKTQAEKMCITEEIYNFLLALNILIQEYANSDSENKDFIYWDKSYCLKENYRHKIKLGLSGQEIEANKSSLIDILDNALKKIDAGIDKAKDAKKDLYYSYFINEVTEYDLLEADFVKPKKFTQKRIPLFLEGQMHALRLVDNINKAKNLYTATKNSQLYDKTLKMYKVTTSLKKMPEEIGRCRVFTPGWLEHESIWLHMEYKYLLEILKSGLYKEFYDDFKAILIPFQKPQRYGRSILENSSFLVSSAFPDKNLHGNGFVARLSGSTAEFIQIWLIMNIGQNPFFLNNQNELNLKLQPILAGWLFNQKGLYSFNFLGNISVTYHNPRRKDTFGKNAAKIERITFNDKDNNPIELYSDTIPYPYAQDLRSCQIRHIDVYFD